jgi:hypothetical protein
MVDCFIKIDVEIEWKRCELLQIVVWYYVIAGRTNNTQRFKLKLSSSSTKQNKDERNRKI